MIGQIDTVAKAVGHAIASTFHKSAGELIELAKLIAFSQGKPLRQVKFRALNVNAQLKGGSYVTTTPSLATATLNDFLHGAQKLSLPRTSAPAHTNRSSNAHHGRRSSAGASPAAIGLYPPDPPGQSEAGQAAVNLPFRVLYPSLQTGPAVQQAVRAYALPDQEHHLHHAYVVVWQQNGLGGYYDLEGTDWLNPPIIAHPDETRKIGDTPT